MTNLQPLLDRLAAATGPDRELDAELWPLEPGFTRTIPLDFEEKRWRAWAAPRYTASLDAALALAERKLPGWGLKIEAGLGYGTTVTIGHVGPNKLYDRPEGWAKAPTLPLALLIALCRALTSKQAL